MATQRKVLTGLEVLARQRPRWLKQRRIGLLMHQASVTRDLVSAREVLHRLSGSGLTALFGPQHGIAGEKQDNMVESPHSTDSLTGVPVFSLYSETRSPTPEMLDTFDTLVVDLQDIGTRIYTFSWTMALAMQACAEADKQVVVLDRPNPLGGLAMEGNLVREGYESFVGLHPLPTRHGLTLGEIALFVNERLDRLPGSARCDLTVVPMNGWRRRMRFPDTGLPWVLPSPNIPTPESAVVFPGQVVLEGTNLSEGRGTTRPFELFGAPFLDVEAVRDRFRKRRLRGCYLRPHDFQPTFQKWAGQVCRGFQLHVTSTDTYLPYLTTLSILQDIASLHEEEFAWRPPPYEYVSDRLPIDVITGDPAVREAIDSGENLRSLAASWRSDIRAFRKETASLLLYRD